MQQPIPGACDNLTQHHWFHSLPLQQFQALLTLFPKSFSPFPHGTCFLSVPNHCLASDESYHPLCAPIPRNVTLRRHTVHRGAANDKQDSHPHWCSFPRDLHLRLCWQCLTRLQVKATGPNFHAELIPVHSPLLWGSCLVSCPPLTYMLKFSRFASLTSCLSNLKGARLDFSANTATNTQCKVQQAVGHQSFAYILHNNGVMHTIAHTCAQARHKHNKLCMPPELNIIDTKAGMLSGISQKHKTRSKLYWFTEFCNSQRLSHFAAPFIVVRAETSIAESCIDSQSKWQTHIMRHSYIFITKKNGSANEAASPHCNARIATLELPHESPSRSSQS